MVRYVNPQPLEGTPAAGSAPSAGTCAGAYSFGFNGQEKDDEVNGATGTSNTAEFWQYDTRTGRRWNLDPKPQMTMSDYAVLSDNPIVNIDPLGDDDYTVNRKGERKFLKPTGDKTDRLIAVSGRKEKLRYDKKTGALMNANTTVTKSILSSYTEVTKTDPKGKQYVGHRIEFGDKVEEADKVFKFLHDNTDVEWTNLTFGDGVEKRSELFTTHLGNREVLGPQRALLLANSQTITYMLVVHNHPRSPIEAEGRYHYPSDEDLHFGRTLRNKKPAALLQIYSEGKLISY